MPAIQSNPCALAAFGFGQFARLARKGGVLVVQSDDPDRAQDRLAQPAQAEQEQQDADDELQGADRNGAHQRPEDGDDERERRERSRGAGQRRAPAARKSDGEHDVSASTASTKRGGE